MEFHCHLSVVVCHTHQEMNSPNPSCVNIHLQITGFGPFQGVADNPSSHLVRALQTHYPKHGRPNHKLLPHVIVETSGVGALQALQSLPAFSGAPHAPDVTHVIVHFGVSESAKAFKVEEKAHNEATFRCPDERQWSPNQQEIIAGGPKSLSSPLPAAKLAETLSALGQFPTALSDDPGRFVCNWLYYSSLHLAQARKEHVRILPLFVHIPSFATVPLEKQLVRVVCFTAVVMCSQPAPILTFYNRNLQQHYLIFFQSL